MPSTQKPNIAILRVRGSNAPVRVSGGLLEKRFCLERGDVVWADLANGFYFPESVTRTARQQLKLSLFWSFEFYPKKPKAT